MKTVAFFNNKGGVGKTSMVYHLAWMFRDLGHHVLATDLDPQSNLTSIFLNEPDVESLWPEGQHPRTVLGAIDSLIQKLGDISDCSTQSIAPRLSLIPGDLGLSTFEDRVSEAWSRCLDDNPANAHDAFRVITAFYRIMKKAAESCGAEIVLIDVGPNIGAINRAALVAADFVVIPLGADLFSLQGLRNLGPTLREWRKGWRNRLENGKPPSGLPLPSGQMLPLGYVLLNPSVRENRPVKSYLKWANRIPGVYSREVLNSKDTPAATAEIDPNQLAMLKHFKSLMPMAQDARKPMFHLTAADGAIGGHAAAVLDCKDQFESLANRILRDIEAESSSSVSLPESINPSTPAA
ncbi:MAG: ParA family protein [Phycisphaeraceae bacterium]|nr:ParA family protein [Phycisphaeraceae bacterium]